MSFHKRMLNFACAAVIIAGVGTLLAQTDPGPRGGNAGAGGRTTTLNPNETILIQSGPDALPGSRFGFRGATGRNRSRTRTHVQRQ